MTYSGFGLIDCGKTGIRTLGARKGTTVFETAPIDHSGIFPGVGETACGGLRRRFSAAKLQISFQLTKNSGKIIFQRNTKKHENSRKKHGRSGKSTNKRPPQYLKIRIFRLPGRFYFVMSRIFSNFVPENAPTG